MLTELFPAFSLYTIPESREAVIAGGLVFDPYFPIQESHQILTYLLQERLSINPQILPPKIKQGSTEMYVRTQGKEIDVYNY